MTMKTSTAMMALVVGLAAPAATEAQLFRREGTPNPRTVPSPKPIMNTPSSRGTPADPAAPATDAAAPRDPKVVPSTAVVPEPSNPSDLPPPSIPLPTDPIEPYLLTKESGPFMVLAHTFRGPNSERYAQALAIELRSKCGLPAYVLRTKDFPGKSNIQGVPPTAPPYVRQPRVGYPEKFRTEDEAAVLVGNEKTLEDSEKLLHRVKKLHPATVDGVPTIWLHRRGEGLKRAIRTTNPYIPAEELFPNKPDMMIQQINQGPHSIFTCPGRYTLQVAEFTGRSTIVETQGTDRRFSSMLDLRRSPLATAADDAEKLASSLAKDKEVMQTGFQPYVYHDRHSSKVMMGAFNAPTDPAAVKLRESLLKMATDLNNRRVTDVMIVPATVLTDLTEVKRR